MTRRQMEIIARRAATLAVYATDQQNDDWLEYYKEYLGQIETGDDDCLKAWIGSQITEGVHEAVEIRKLWLKAKLAVA